MTTSGLRLSSELALPIDVAGEAIAILAKRGAGKTNTATVLVEELVAAGVQVVVLDPVGAWWGLRLGAKGAASGGLEIPIVGGEHGDVPLESTAGTLIADVVVDSGQSLLVDLSDFPSKAAVARFVTDFADRLYRAKARSQSLLHLVLEEADAFAPQKVRADDSRMAWSIEQIVRRGRGRGLGLTMVTQRSAVLNKDVLSQADVLIAMRTTSPHDRKAIEAWIAAHDEEGSEDVLPSLPSLKTGEAWVWNPERGLLERVMVRRRRTFDSSATPKAGERHVAHELAAIDLETLGARIQDTVERAKENDPRELRQRVHKLERELAQRPTETKVEKVFEQVPVEVPVLDEAHVALLVESVKTMRELGSALQAQADQFTAALSTVERAPRPAVGAGRTERASVASATSPPASAARAPARRPAPTTEAGDVQLKAGARRILETLARHHPMRVTRAQLGTLSRFKVTGGTFQTYFSQLKRLGLIEEFSGEISITDAGLDYVGHVPPAPQTTEELLDMWRGALKAGARTMLDVLVDVYPDSLEKNELADRVEMTATGGTFQTYLSTLRRNGLAAVDGAYVRASETLFIGAAA